MTDGKWLRFEAERCFCLARRVAAPNLSADLVARGRALERQAGEHDAIFGRVRAARSGVVRDNSGRLDASSEGEL
jgi:hypothetical protein